MVGDCDRTCSWKSEGGATLCRHPVDAVGEWFLVGSAVVPTWGYSFAQLASILIVVGVSGSTFVGFAPEVNDCE